MVMLPFGYIALDSAMWCSYTVLGVLRMKRFLSLLICLTFILLQFGCSFAGGDNSPYITPDLTWNSEISAIKELYGDNSEQYETEDGCIGYKYEYTYDGISGDLRFIFDKDNKLSKVSFQSVIDAEDEFDTISSRWLSTLKEKYGEAYFENESGSIWLADDEAISLVQAEIVSEIFTYRTLGMVCIKAPEDGFQIDNIDDIE